MATRIAAAFGLLLAWAGSATLAADQFTQAEHLFTMKVRPLLSKKCFACHGEKPKEIQGELNLMSREGMLAGGESEEPALVPYKPEESPIYLAIQWDDLEMPPKENDRLSAKEIEQIRQWIAAGAPWPSAERQKELAAKDWADPTDGVVVYTSGGLSPVWTDRKYEREDLWAYQPVKRHAVPWKALQSAKPNSSPNPIDAFIEQKLNQRNLRPAPRVDQRTLIRRATLDLTGLPPTREELDAFLQDESPAAFEKVIDRLLVSKRYGEQMARHWLDVVRYADSSGFSNDFTRPNAWRYRDYVIRAFNSDKPYDQFIREQIAGDEIDPNNVENLIAVGFLRMGPWEHTGMSVATVTRQQFLDDVTHSVGVTFLAQALRCASCHDHKFDPIPTRDYYRFQAIFASLQFADRKAEYMPVENDGGFEEGKARIDQLLAGKGVKSLRTLPREEWPAREFDEDTEKKGHRKVENKRQQYLKRELLRYKPLAMSVYSGPGRVAKSQQLLHPMPGPKQRKGTVENVYILMGGALESPGDLVTPGVLSVIEGAVRNEDRSSLGSVPKAIQGRRLALANWIASSDNPLTSRVMVNRIWQYHFGKAIAGNPNNFGKTGKKPTHPELLDFLATYFVGHGWSIKEMHRLIMLSETYRRSGIHPDPKRTGEVDPDNELLAVFSSRPLGAEELRDSMLFVSGELNLEMGGIPARPEINMEVAMQPRHIMGSVGPAYQPMRTPAERNRRTIYAERIRTLRDPMLEVFNQPGLDTSCERRGVSTTTPQVFTLFNSQNSYDRALALAKRLGDNALDVPGRIDLAFQLTLGRSATPREQQRCRRHFERMVQHHPEHPPVRVDPPKYVIRGMVEEMTGLRFCWVEDLDVYHDYVPDLKPWDVEPDTRALADLCLVLFNSNEFVYVY